MDRWSLQGVKLKNLVIWLKYVFKIGIVTHVFISYIPKYKNKTDSLSISILLLTISLLKTIQYFCGVLSYGVYHKRYATKLLYFEIMILSLSMWLFHQLMTDFFFFSRDFILRDCFDI